MDEKYVVSEEMKKAKINASVLKMMKASRILMIVGWSLAVAWVLFIYSFIGFYLISIASIIIAIQLIRKQRVAHGVCMILFGSLSLGIWPFVVATKEKNRIENSEFNASNETVNVAY